MFPAGEVSSLRRLAPARRGSALDPGDFVRLARRTKAALLPLHIAGRNSGLFQAAGLLHPACGRRCCCGNSSRRKARSSAYAPPTR
jgi:putative hemolysin